MDTLHFRESELECSCCGSTVPNLTLLAVLEMVRVRFNKPVFINSGFRCKRHNRHVGGSEKSQHLLGTAADIEVEDIPPTEVYKFINSIFPEALGLGLYKTFVHIDVREGCARWNG